MIYNIKEVNTLNNICFFNYQVNKVNSLVHKKITHIRSNLLHTLNKENIINYNKIDYYKDLYIVCKKHAILKDAKNKKFKMKLFVNQEYKIVKIDNQTFTIKNEIDNSLITSKGF